jgi:hypothetical protein
MAFMLQSAAPEDEMNRWHMLNTSVAAVCCSAVLGAQAPGSTQSTSQQRGTTAGERVTITGCVERADQLTQPGGNTVGTTVDSQHFVLMKADAAGTSASEPAGAVGTSGSVGPLYRLEGEESQLNGHVGHKVEITGTREGSQMANAAAQAANATNPTADNAPQIKVESVKMLAESCPR